MNNTLFVLTAVLLPCNFRCAIILYAARDWPWVACFSFIRSASASFSESVNGAESASWSWPSNAMTSSEERTSAEAESSRLPHREGAGGVLIKGERSNPSTPSSRFSLRRGFLISDTDHSASVAALLRARSKQQSLATTRTCRSGLLLYMHGVINVWSIFIS